MFQMQMCDENVKSLFRKLSKYLHPDVGGDKDLFRMLVDARDGQLSYLKDINEMADRCEEEEDELEQDNDWDGEFRKIEDNIYKNDGMLIAVIEIMSSYSKSHNKFDPSFLIKMIDACEEKGFMTANQFNALLKTFKAFRMEEWEYDIK